MFNMFNVNKYAILLQNSFLVMQSRYVSFASVSSYKDHSSTRSIQSPTPPPSHTNRVPPLLQSTHQPTLPHTCCQFPCYGLCIVEGYRLKCYTCTVILYQMATLISSGQDKFGRKKGGVTPMTIFQFRHKNGCRHFGRKMLPLPLQWWRGFLKMTLRDRVRNRKTTPPCPPFPILTVRIQEGFFSASNRRGRLFTLYLSLYQQRF